MAYPIFHSQYTAAQIEGSIGKSPRINSSSHWEVWDIETGAYVDTGVSADAQEAATRAEAAAVAALESAGNAGASATAASGSARAAETAAASLVFDQYPIFESDHAVTSNGIALTIAVHDGIQAANLAQPFSTSVNYLAGEYCTQDSGEAFSRALYRFIRDKAAGAWDATAVERVALADDVANNLSVNSCCYDGVDLTLKFATEIAASPYSGDPWPWIKARIQAANFIGIHVNDYIPFTTTNSVALKACVGGINTYKGYGDVAVGNHIDFICRELWPTRKPFNPVSYNNGTKFGDAEATEYPWLASDLYLFLNSLSGTVASDTTVGGGTGTAVDYTQGGVYYYLPANLKNVINEKRAYLPKRYSESGLLSDDNAGGWANIGKLWLPSEWEVYGGPVWGGRDGYATRGNCVQYPIFANNMNRVKNRSGSRDHWWVLSAYSGNNTSWCAVANNGAADYYTTSNANITAPVCFRIS